jgi:hypothetical protein
VFGQIAAPLGKVGPVRINFVPNFAEAAAAQGVELGPDRNNARTQRNELIALRPLLAKQNRQAIGLAERLAKLG